MTAGAIAVPTIVPLRPPIPGQHKAFIDTETKIEIHSDTPGVTIYYTVNGEKPEPFQPLSPAGKNTYKYQVPFRLPGGKRVLKAVAVSADGLRESHVVSKKFDVEQLEIDPSRRNEDDLDFVNDIPAEVIAKKHVNKFAHKMVTSKQAWEEVQRMRQSQDSARDATIGGSSHRRPQNHTRFLDSRSTGVHGGTSSRSQYGQGDGMNGVTMNGTLDGDMFTRSMRRTPPDTATQAMRLQRETDFLKCVYCFAPRPSDPYTRFCNECGNNIPPLPQSKILPPEPGQMGTCVECNSVVPFNAPTCIICEAPIGPQNQPQASIKLAQKLMCTVCGTANPANISSCVTCESKLLLNGKPITLQVTQPPAPTMLLDNGHTDNSHRLTCSKCGRTNVGDARFCDWCGSKPTAPGSSISCQKCGAANQPYAKFCGSCGGLVEPPQRPELRSAGVSITLNPEIGGKNAQAQWLPVALPGRPVPASSVATQTVGLFYPSTRDMLRKQEEEEEKIAMEKQMRDRKPLLTAISPGRGYWRKQVEHICTHVKAHAQNNAEFRALIAEPRMGKILSTAVHEDGYELSLTVNFALRGTKDPLMGEKLNYTQREYLSTYTEGRKSSLSRFPSNESLESGLSTTRSTTKKGKKKVVKKAKTKKPNPEDKLSVEDKKLLKELGKNGEGLASEVQQLIDEGADPCCVNKDGYPALLVAVQNKHVDAIPILVQEGADVNEKGPDKGNTALHESVGLGREAAEVIDCLLGLGANTQKKNDKGETPYDLAIKAHEDGIAKRLASSLGQNALDKLIKPKGTKTDLF